VRLIAAVALACVACGAVIAWLGRARDALAPRLEATIAVLAIVVVPATLLGSLEGEQAGLVISALLAIAITVGAEQLLRRRLLRACRPTCF
jgi:hypothetical protein